MYQLRNYQISLINQIYAQYRQGFKRVMAQLPTGAGKTIIFSAIIKGAITKGLRVLILAHRVELILQAVEKIQATTNQSVGIIKSGYHFNFDLLIQVASVQTLINRLNNLKSIDLIIIDEAHHSASCSYIKILKAYPDAYILGVTATPIRLDGKGFRDLFDVLVCGISTKELIELGYLSPYRLFACPKPINTVGVKKVNGDYSIEGLSNANNSTVVATNLFESYSKIAHHKQCLIFAFDVEYSRTIIEQYCQNGIPAYHLDGKTPNRERVEILEKFKAKEIKVLSNCQLFDEGLDVSGIEVIQIARPTQSLTRWLQMIGRGLRFHEGKDCALILDHTNNWLIHGLPCKNREWSLDGWKEIKEEEQALLIQDRESGEVRERVITEVKEDLEEIVDPDNKRWELIYRGIKSQYDRGMCKKGWIYYRLLELNAPLYIWKQCAKDLGYKPQWANHCYRSSQKKK